jgi:hypothetical protein
MVTKMAVVVGGWWAAYLNGQSVAYFLLLKVKVKNDWWW